MKMSERTTRIQTDSQNRIILTHTFKETIPGKTSYKTVIKKAGARTASQKLVLDGTWSLTEEHALKFHVLSSQSDLAGKDLIFHGQIEHAGGNFLRFRIRRLEPLSGIKSGTIGLSGTWWADRYNRICFDINKGKGRYDTLRFQGAWQVNRNNELIYRYSMTRLKTKVRRLHTVIFRGFWELQKHRIIYRMEGSSGSFFSFQAVLKSHNVRSSDRGIDYQIGIRFLEREVFRKREQTVTILGKWQIKEDLKVSFEVSYSGRKRQEILFGVEKILGKGNTITVSLKDPGGGKMGLEVVFRKTFSKDRDLFISLARSAEEFRVQGGVTIKF